MKSKVSDEQLIELIAQGANDTEIARQLGVTAGGIYRRLKELRKNHGSLPASAKEFDLQELDTVRIGVKRFRVTAISREGFSLREVMSDEEIKFSRRTPQVREFSKVEYLAGKTGVVKLDKIEPVKTYIDEKLKKREGPMERKPALINSEFEAAVQDMIASRQEAPKLPPEPIKIAEVKSESTETDKAPENRYLSDIDQIVCLCKPYAGNQRIRESVGDLAQLILSIGVDLELTGGGHEA